MNATPQKLGRYEVLEEIGKGAMGVVYLARDPLIGRLVALKTFRVGFAARDEELAQFRSRFVREAQSAGILSHPNIVTIHDVVDEGPSGICFIAMEYVKGTNLKQLLGRPDALPLGFVIEVLSQVADALDYAHSRGVIHRDIKPANILITPENRVKITDFGIARIESSNLTMEGQLLGTPNYMAPEQIQGKDVDHRADIFSLGVVFYEMLTRKKPFQGENMTAVTHKIVFEPFRPPSEIVSDLPTGLSTILSRCLEKDPGRRYPRAAEVGRELRAVLSTQQSLEDTVATQEVKPIEGEDGGDAAAPGASEGGKEPAAAEGAAAPSAPEAAKTQLVARPPIPPPPGGAPASDQAKTTLVERPPIPPRGGAPASEQAKTTLVERPPIPAGPGSTATPASEQAKTKLVARPPIPKAGEGPGTAGSAAPGAAATVLTPIPKGSSVPLPPRPAPRTSSSEIPVVRAGGEPQVAADAPEAWPRQKIGLFAAAAVAMVALLVVVALWVSGGDSPEASVRVPAPAPTPEQQNRVTAAAAIAEARTQLASGNLSGALQAVARAELAEPGSTETSALREEIESRQRELDEEKRQAAAEEGLKVARYAFAERRYGDAIRAANAVLEGDAANDEARKIVADSERVLRRMRERQDAIAEAQRAERQEPAEAERSVAAPVQPRPQVSREAQVQIEFASDKSEGVLTIYAGDRQILREPFRFVRRTGLLAREKVSGTISAVRKVPAGALTLRVYVALPGIATRAISLEETIEGGASRLLEIRVDSAGNASAVLR